MAFVEQAHVNDIGVILRVTVYDTNATGGTTVADMSSESTKKLKFRRPDVTTFKRVAVYTNTGADGVIQSAMVRRDVKGPRQ